MKKPFLITCVMLSVATTIGGLASCASTPTSESTGQYIDNSVITADVKAALLADSEVKSLAISVKSYKGNVELSGFVNNIHQHDRAIFIASHVKGVVAVKDGLVIKH